eukprot:1650079-Rhodomonas_salina.1
MTSIGANGDNHRWRIRANSPNDNVLLLSSTTKWSPGPAELGTFTVHWQDQQRYYSNEGTQHSCMPTFNSTRQHCGIRNSDGTGSFTTSKNRSESWGSAAYAQ